ncbi:GtrA family protein, partial [bacterium]
MENNKKDYKLVTTIGFLVGWLVLLPAKNLDLVLSPVLILSSVVGLTILAPIALFILKRLSRFWPVFDQFGKFAAVGTLNTLLDLGVLNLLMFLTGLYGGFSFVGFKAISFLAGTTNSYFWNKLWTFQNKLPVTFSEYLRFGAFTLVGALINVGVASLIVNVIGAPANFNPKLWANIGALVAVLASFLWNFLSYRNIVFKNRDTNIRMHAN